ncbi:MAG: hypothetical protein AB8B77_05125 [Alphaproteobacteria bacterium]
MNDVNNDSAVTITGGNAVIQNLTSDVAIDTDNDGTAENIILSYVGWGEWASSTGNDLTITAYGNSQQVSLGNVVAVTNLIGEYTDPDDLPQIGSADFAGIVQGFFTDNSALGGTMNMNVDFGTDLVTGSMALTKAEVAWASPDFENGRLTAFGEFEADLSDGTNNMSGGLDGTLFGTSLNPTEAMGALTVSKAGGEDAAGVFVAVAK